jgi:DNA damage-inducible protein 1
MFERVYNEMQKQSRELQERQARMTNADPFDVEAQKMIEEEIRKQNIAKNYAVSIFDLECY